MKPHTSKLRAHAAITALLLLATSTPALRAAESAPASSGGILLEDFTSLNGWKVLDGAGGAFATFKPAESTPLGAPGALQGRFPGIIYKELSPDQCRQSDNWNEYAGLSFWVKGDGSENSGCLAIGPAGEKSWAQGFGSSGAHVFYFPLKDKEWHQVTAAWHEFVPEETQPAIGARGGMTPGEIRVLRLGNRWFNHHPEEPRPGQNYAVGRIQFVKKAPPAKAVPPLPPLSGVLEKLKKKQPVRIQVMGDSITAGHSVEVFNGERYSDRLCKFLKAAYGYEDITVVNRAVCGARIADARGWVARDFAGNPPDLLVFMYGTNDSVVCKPAEFARMLEEYLDRVAVATGGRTAVLPLATIPGAFARFTITDPFAQQVREVAIRRGLAYCDLHAVFKELGFDKMKTMMITSLVHPSAEGHDIIARTIADFLTQGPPSASTSSLPHEKLLAIVTDPGALRSHRLFAAHLIVLGNPAPATFARLLEVDDKTIQGIAIDSLDSAAAIKPQLASLLPLAGTIGQGGIQAGPIGAAIARTAPGSLHDLDEYLQQHPELLPNYLSLLSCVPHPEATKRLVAIVRDPARSEAERLSAVHWLQTRPGVEPAGKEAVLEFLLPLLNATGKTRAGVAARIAGGFVSADALWFNNPRVGAAAEAAAVVERAQAKPDAAFLAQLDRILKYQAPAAAATTATPALNFIEPFKDAEYAAAHVEGTSHPLPQDFVDCPWQGIIAASDGKTYFFVSSHAPGHAAQFYSFDPKNGTVKHLADVGAWCNDSVPASQGQVHHVVRANLFEHHGKIYAVTGPAQVYPGRRYPGGHFLAYSLATGKCEDLGMVADPDSNWGFAAAALDSSRERLYALQQQGKLYYYDLKTGAVVEAGRLEPDGCEWQPRTLICDPNGVVYGSGLNGEIPRYDPETRAVSTLQTRVPHDPDFAQPKGPSSVSNSAWEATRLERLVWDPKGSWWYGVRGNDEFLCRFRPPGDAQSSAGSVEGLGVMAFPGKKARNGSLGLALLGRRLYYVSAPGWSPMAHLMSYDLETGAITHHGPIVVEDGRRVSELQSLVAGTDGKLHGVAMVWSLSDKDPAPAGAIRGKWNFHPRFVVIDPAKDFQSASPLADLPESKPRKVEYKPGQSLLVYSPAGTNAGPRPAAVFIHGGGWHGGNPEQFALHARYYAARGLVGISVGYRLAKPPETTVPDCVSDVKSAVRWIRKHAYELGIDPARIVVLGDSAGGHLAAAMALLPGLDAPGDDLAISARPDALVLFNPVIDTTPPDGWDLKTEGEPVAARAKDLSPMDHVTAGAPPTLVIHGSADTLTPLAGSERFVAAMMQAGNPARLETLDGKDHAFIVPGYGGNATIARALELTDEFLQEQNILEKK